MKFLVISAYKKESFQLTKFEGYNFQ